ncbi:hypothetical protein KIL84_022110 [Mauremys mutica]|uniref:Uncharacterized protein n=1 Tax=Mauremys mutica TaxID=74926 RepID=A0A9D3XAC0_9SAUR|nr:hypothetical protein KIL84_022110 [Mauremys mutica]
MRPLQESIRIILLQKLRLPSLREEQLPSGAGTEPGSQRAAALACRAPSSPQNSGIIRGDPPRGSQTRMKVRLSSGGQQGGLMEAEPQRAPCRSLAPGVAKNSPPKQQPPARPGKQLAG